MTTLFQIARAVSRIAGLVVLFYAPYALAVGEDITMGKFSCSNGAATGQLLATGGSCPTSLQITNVFSFLMCNIEQISSNILGHMYCGLIYELTPAVWALATLAVIIFGISFTIGLVPATGREAMLFIIKIAFVAGFATNAELIISYAYRFLIDGMREGVGIAISGLGALGGSHLTNGNDTYAMLDKFLYSIFKAATDAVGETMPEKRCQNAIFAVIATFSAVFPIFGYLAILLIGRILLAFYRAVFGYIYAIVGITFLIVLSPFFVPLYWFKITQMYFDKWLGYLVSFSLQMVLVFASIAFILSLPLTNMVKTVPSVIMYWDETKETTSFRLPWSYCTLCDFKVVDRDTGADMPDNDPNLISKGQLQCIVHNPVNVRDALGNLPDKDKPATDSNGYKPITLTFAFAPESGATSSSQMNNLVKLAGYGIISLIVLALVLTQVLEQMPALAQNLAGRLGATYAPQLGGGSNARFATPDLPGESLGGDFKAGFDQSMQPSNLSQYRSQLQNRETQTYDPAKRAAQTGNSVTDGLRGLVSGRGKDNAALYDKENMPGADAETIKARNEGAGIGGAWRRFIEGGFLSDEGSKRANREAQRRRGSGEQ